MPTEEKRLRGGGIYMMGDGERKRVLRGVAHYRVYRVYLQTFRMRVIRRKVMLYTLYTL